MAQAFALMSGEAEAYSAGSRPSGKVNPKAIAAMAELGYDLSAHSSKSLDEVKEYAPFDAVVTMGCGDACPFYPGTRYEDWDLEDPAGQGVDAVRTIRDDIEQRVRTLLASLEVTVA